LAKKSALSEKLDEVKDRIAAACAKAKRETSEVTLIAVTKTAAPEQLREILTLGVADLGESRAQQLTQRALQLNEFHTRQLAHGSEGVADKLRWHMVGHVQRNKIKQLLPVVSIVHSIDSLRLAEELDIQAGRIGKKLPVMMQVNASEESQKYGVAVGASVHLAEQIGQMDHLQILGLMCMAPFTEDEKVIRHCFTRTHEIFEEMKWHKIGGPAFKHLSMGMSHDYQIAIEEGSTMVRVGSALFGGKADDRADEEE